MRSSNSQLLPLLIIWYNLLWLGVVIIFFYFGRKNILDAILMKNVVSTPSCLKHIIVIWITYYIFFITAAYDIFQRFLIFLKLFKISIFWDFSIILIFLRLSRLSKLCFITNTDLISEILVCMTSELKESYCYI